MHKNKVAISFAVITGIIITAELISKDFPDSIYKNQSSGISRIQNQPITITENETGLAEDFQFAEMSGLTKLNMDSLPEPAGLSSQSIKQARNTLFNGKHENGQFLQINSDSNKRVKAGSAHEVKSVLFDAGRDYFSIREEDDMVIQEAKVDDLNNVFYSYQQTYKGIPVEGRILLVQTNKTDDVVYITGQYEKGINVDLDNLNDGQQVTNAVLESLADASAFEPIIHSAPEIRIYVDNEKNRTIPTYRSVVEYNDFNGINHLDEIFVDAKEATLVKRFTLINTALNREVYSTKYLYCIGTPGIPESYTLPGYYRFGESGPTSYSDSEEKLAYSHTGSSYWFYKYRFKRDSYDGNGVRIRSSVHSQFMTPDYQCSGDNAQYRPAPYDQLIFGTGDTGPGLSESLDVVGHELTHGVTHNTSGLKYEYETGAINEAVSDIFGAGIEAWVVSGGSKSNNPAKINTSSSTWTVCSQCASGLQRYMNNPTRDGNSKDYYPEKYTGSDDNGGVHLNSGIFNLAFYLLSEGGRHPRGKTTVSVNGIGIDKALQIYYDANTNMFKVLTDTKNAFVNARNLLAQAAENRYGKCSTEWKSVHDSFVAVGVGNSSPSCSSTGSGTSEPEQTIAGTNLAQSATAYASSYYRYGYEPKRMNDADLSTQWRSRQIFSPYQYEYATLDFGKSISFRKLTIAWSGSDYPRIFYVQALDSNNFWRTIKKVSKYSSGDTVIDVSGQTRQLRIIMTYGAYYRWFAIKEFKVE